MGVDLALHYNQDGQYPRSYTWEIETCIEWKLHVYATCVWEAYLATNCTACCMHAAKTQDVRCCPTAQPMYGIMSAKLQAVSQSLFEQRDFSSIDVLKVWCEEGFCRFMRLMFYTREV